MKISDYLKEKKSLISCFLILIVMMNLYLISLPLFKDSYFDLWYLDILFIMIILVFLGYDYVKLKQRYQPLIEAIYHETVLNMNEILGESYEEQLLKKVFTLQLEAKQQERYELQQALKDMEDYLTQWVHEIKLPLATLMMILERIEDIELQLGIQTELEKINVLVNGVLFGSRTTSSSEDMVIKEERLDEVVRQAIKNNAFFLIKHRVDIDFKVESTTVFTDRKWIVYVLDQLILNAIKYRKENACLHFSQKNGENKTQLIIKDEGMGIKPEEISRIFNKGFTGSHGRENTYKSTGMGLYFSKRIIDRLEHEIEVKSVVSEYTEFTITFYHLSDYVKMTKSSH